MSTLRDSLSKKLTAMNLLVSGGALILASTAFFAYDVITFRANLINNTSTQAQTIRAARISAHHLCRHLYPERQAIRGLLAPAVCFYGRSARVRVRSRLQLCV
jgi:hypothetical protein